VGKGEGGVRNRTVPRPGTLKALEHVKAKGRTIKERKKEVGFSREERAGYGVYEEERGKQYL